MKALNSFYGRLALTLFFLLTAVGLGMVAVSHRYRALYQEEATQRVNLDLARHIVSETLFIRDGQVNEPALESIFHALMVVNPNIELYLLDPKGKIIAYSAPPGRVKRNKIAIQPICEFLSAKPSLPILGDDPRDPSGHKIFSAAPIGDVNNPQGYLYIILASEDVTAIAQRLGASYVQRESTWTIFMAMAAAFAAGLFALFGMTRRLRSLMSEVEKFKQDGFLESVAPIQTNGDEIAQLAICFHQMARRIERQMEELRQADGLRREQVARISHDLRTSLTALHGYLETLQMKADTLGKEETNQFLDTAVKHSRRLSRLVSDFFELSKLEYRESVPELEPISMSDLVQDVVLKFKPMASSHGVNLHCDHSSHMYWVDADIGMMERVLTNLFDNAIKFTPVGGSIRVNLESRGGEILIQVSDTGCGIEPAQLQMLLQATNFDSMPRSSHPDSSGLGLAIVKRILMLHGSRLTIESEPGQGSSFAFTLPAATRESI